MKGNEMAHEKPANARKEPAERIRNRRAVVGGMTQACTALGALLYGRIVDRVIPVSSPEVAEFTKILENTFRGVNIALVNELKILADKMGRSVAAHRAKIVKA